MAYFPNGSSCEILANQCGHCKYGEEPCPIYQVQVTYNYDACNDQLASAILNDLVSNEKGCEMFNRFKKDVKEAI